MINPPQRVFEESNVHIHSLCSSRHVDYSKLSYLNLVVFIVFFLFYFIFKLYNIVLVLPNIEMNLPQVYLCSPSWTLLPPPSPYPPSGTSQCTSPKHTVSCITGLATRFIHDIIHVSMPFSQFSPPSPSPTESIRLFYTSVFYFFFSNLDSFYFFFCSDCCGQNFQNYVE